MTADRADKTDDDGSDRPLIPDATADPTDASKYSTAEEEVVTKEDRDPEDR